MQIEIHVLIVIALKGVYVCTWITTPPIKLMRRVKCIPNLRNRSIRTAKRAHQRSQAAARARLTTTSVMNHTTISITWRCFIALMVNHEPDAWELLQQCFSPLVRGWMRSHPQRNLACRYELEENYVANTFTRVWQASMHNRLEFDTLVAALSYLKLSLQGTILDTLRVYAQPREVPLRDADSVTYSSEKPAIKKDYKSSDLWEIIKGLLYNERERRLAYLLFHCGLKPIEIVRCYPDEFGELQEIIRLTRNIMERLICLRD